MRNLYISLALFFSIILTHNSTCAQQQFRSTSVNTDVISIFPWTESFEEINLPQGWEQSVQPGYIPWILKEEKISGIPEGIFHTTYSSYIYLSALHDKSRKLITPAFDLSHISDPLLFFRFTRSSRNYQDTLKIYYKNNSDTLWRLLADINDGTTQWTEKSISLASVPDGEPVSFAFEVQTYMGNIVIGLDDIMIGSGRCERVGDVTVSNITSSSARLSWEIEEENRNWLLSFRDLNESRWSSDIILSEPEYIFPNTVLQPATPYQIKIQQLCGMDEAGLPRFIYFTTACENVDLPLFETFDMITVENGMESPECWSFYGTGVNQGNVVATEYHSFPHSYCLRSSSDLSVTNDLLSPYLTDNLRDLQVSFYAKSQSYSGSGDIELGYLSDPDNPETFVPYTRIFLTENWQLYSVKFDSLITEAHRISFRHGNNITYNSLYLDDIIIERIPGCDDGNIDSLRVTNKKTKSLTIEWTESQNTGYDIRYAIAGTSNWIIRHDISSPFVLEGLENSSLYEFSLRTVCGDETGAWILPVSEWTAEKIPFKDNFDDFVSRDWRVVKNTLSPGTITTSEFPDEYLSYPRAIVLNNGNCRPVDKLWFTSPELDPNVNFQGQQLRFKAKASVPGSVLSLGFIDPDDIHSFRLVESIPLTSEWTTYVVRFEGYTGNERRLAFGHNGNIPATLLYIDDIELDKSPHCREVSHISYCCAQGDGFVLNWKDIASDIYYIDYKTTGSGTYITKVADTNCFIFTDLAEATDYTVRISSGCLPRIWSDSVVINTSVKPDTMPFREDFEIVSSWIIDNGNQPNRWLIGNDTNANDNDGNRCLYITNENDYRYDITDPSIVYVYQNVIFNKASDYRIKYEWKNGNSSGIGNNNYMQAWIVPDGISFRSGILSPTEGWIRASNSERLVNQTEWKEEEVVISIDNPGIYKLLFIWYNDGRGGNLPPAAVDNIEITRIRCSAPRDVEVISVTKDRVNIKLKYPSNTSFIRFYYRTSQELSWTDSVDHPVPISRSGIFSVTGLEPAQEYVLVARTFCLLGEASAMSLPVTFNTGCEEVNIPWYEQFNNSVFPPNECWKRKNYLFDPDYPMFFLNFQEPGGLRWKLEEVFGNNAASINIYFRGQNNWLISPEIYLEDKSDYYLQMDVKYLSRNQNLPAYLDQFIVLVSRDAGNTWDPADATIWQENNPQADYPLTDLNRFYQTLTVLLPDMDSIIKVAFYMGSESYGEDNVLYLDNISIGKCPRPLDLSIEYINYDSTRISWKTYQNIYSSWEIKYGIQGFDPDTVNPVIVNDTCFILTDLDPNTIYDFHVRTLCDADYSVWVKSSFHTSCNPVTEFPYFETFEPDSSFDCWRIKNDNGDELSWEISDYKPYHDDHSIRFDTDLINNFDDDYLVSVPFTLTGNEYLYYYVSTLDPDFPRSYQVLISPTPEFLRENTVILLEDTASTILYKAIELDLSGYAGVYYIAFYIPDGGIRQSTIFIDEFSIETAPTCIRPTELTYVSRNPGSVELAWQENNNAQQWEIEYGPLTFNQGDETAVRVFADTNPYEIFNIESSQYYEFYVRSVCGAGDTSKWSGKEIFTTFCSPITQYPYSQDFEYFGMMPPCWSEVILSGTTKWKFKPGVDGQIITAPHSGLLNAAIMSNVSTSYRNMLVSPVFDISHLNQPYIALWYILFDSYGNHDNLKLYYRNSLSDSWTLLKDFETANNWAFDSIPLVSPSSTYQLAFEGSSNTYSAYGSGIDQLFIDEVRISPCIMPININITFITQHTAMVSWDPDMHEGDWILAFKSDDEDSYHQIICEEPYYELTDLQPNTLYHLWVKSRCDAGESFPVFYDFQTRDESVIFHYIHVTSSPGIDVEPHMERVPVEEGFSQRFNFSAGNNQDITVMINGTHVYHNISTYTFENVRGDSSLYLTLPGIGIPDHENDATAVRVFPNPAGRTLNILLSVPFDQIQIINLRGEIIFYNHIPDMHMRIDIGDLKSGIYFVRVFGPQGIFTTKFIKE